MSMPVIRSVMLDLDACVHLDKIEIAGVIEEFKGAGSTVFDAFAGVDATLADVLAFLVGDPRRGRFLDHLLVAALCGTITLAEVYRVAVLVGEHLDLDMAWVLQVLFQVHGGIAEGAARLLARELEGVVQMRLGVYHAHAAPAAAGRGLDDHGVAHFAGDTLALIDVVAQGAVRTGHARDIGLAHGLDGRNLVAHQPNCFGPRADENEPAFLDPFGEICILGQKAVTGMNRDRVGDLGGRDDGGNIQVTFARGRRADAHGLVGHPHVLEVAVDR